MLIFTNRIGVVLRRPEAGEEAELSIPFAASLPFRKGVAYSSGEAPKLDERDRDALLQTIALARAWIADMVASKVATLEQIAEMENLGVRHVRRLATLAFLSPKIIQAFANGDARTGLSVSRLTEALPHSWTEQEKMFGLA